MTHDICCIVLPGDAGSLEEGIPLKTFSVSTGSHAQGGKTAVDN